MTNFEINKVGPEALQIDFVKPYSGNITDEIKSVLDNMGAVHESDHHNTYTWEYFSWYSSPFGKFTLTDYNGNYSLYTQGNNELIDRIAAALEDSGLFKQVSQ